MSPAAPAEVEAAPAAPARRDTRGMYPLSQRGRLAIDGSILDRDLGGVAGSSAWFDPSCEYLQCVLPQYLRLVPKIWKSCSFHGARQLAPEDPFPLAGAERFEAETRAWSKQLDKYPVPLRYGAVAFETAPERTPALITAEQYADSDDDELWFSGVVMQGGVGCGKTYAAVCALRRLVVWGGGTVVFYPFPKLVTDLLHHEDRRAIFASLLEADDVIIDDLGSSYLKPDGAAAGLFEELVVAREARQYPALFTTNLDPKAFRRLFGARVFDRLRGEWGRWIDVSCPSLRRKTPKQ